MALAFNVTIRNNRLTQILSAIDAGAGPGLVRVYNGSRPATGGTVTTLLATWTLPDPAGTVNAGVFTFGAIAPVNIIADGTATWFRIVDSTGAFVLDGSVGLSGSDLNLNAVVLVTGAQLSISSFTITEGNA